MRLIDADVAIRTLENSRYSPDYCKEHGIDHSISMEMVRILLNVLPSAESECKTGQWIQLTCDSAEWWYCSECNGRVQMNPWAKYNYCPNCGTDMRSEQNE